MAENRVQNTRQFEARLNSPRDSKLTWAGGLYYYWTNNTGTFQNIILPGSAGMAISTTQPVVAACPRSATTAALAYCYTWNNTDKSVQETGSAYADTSYPVTDVFRINAGARYSHDWRSQRSTPDGSNPGSVSAPFTAYDYTCSFLAAGYNPRTCVNYGSWKAFTYSTGVEYDVLQNSMLYGTYKTGYQPGALSATRANGKTDKLELEQITVGFKSRWLDNRVQANIEAFDTTYHNRALTGAVPTVQLNDAVPTTPNTTNTCAAGSAVYRVSKNADGSACVSLNNGTPTIPMLKSTGVDLDIYFLPTSSDRIDLAVEWLKSDYDSVPDILTDYPTAAQLQGVATLGTGAAALTTAEAQTLSDKFRQQVEAYQGLMLQNSAEWSASFNYQHEFRFSSGASLTPKISGSYKSKYWSQSGAGGNIYTVNQALESGKARYNPNGTVNLAIQPSYSLFDFTTTWRGADGKFTVTGYLKNIENEPIMRNTNGNANVTLAAPRTYGVTMSANF
jgi:iron complex outermembrane receptor protein